MSNSWDQLALHRHAYLKEGKDKTFKDLLLPKIKEILREASDINNLEVLDVGCGTGFLTEIISHQVKKVVGIDSSQQSIDVAKKHVSDNENIQVECVSIEDFAPKHSNEFNFAIAHMTLQTIENLDEAILGISTVLKSHGKFLFSIPHPCFWASIKSEIGNNNYKYHIQSAHENTFYFSEDLQISVPYFHRSLEAYSLALKRNGFSIMQIYEPFPTDELMKKYDRPWFSPGFLFMLCRKDELEGKHEQ